MSPCIFHYKRIFFRGLFCINSYWKQSKSPRTKVLDGRTLFSEISYFKDRFSAQIENFFSENFFFWEHLSDNKLTAFKGTKMLISFSYLIRQSFTSYRCKSGICIFSLRIAWNYESLYGRRTMWIIKMKYMLYWFLDFHTNLSFCHKLFLSFPPNVVDL